MDLTTLLLIPFTRLQLFLKLWTAVLAMLIQSGAVLYVLAHRIEILELRSCFENVADGLQAGRAPIIAPRLISHMDARYQQVVSILTCRT